MFSFAVSANGGEGADRRRERELHRVVPRTHDAGHAQRLRHQVRASGLELQGRGDALALHPARQRPDRVLDARSDDVEFGEPRLVRRPVAEVGVDRGHEIGLAIAHDRPEPGEPIAAHRERRVGLPRERFALSAEQALERFECGAGHFLAADPRSRSSRAYSGDWRSATPAAARSRSTCSSVSTNDVGVWLRNSRSDSSDSASKLTSIA